MPSELKALFGTRASLTISLGSLASSTVGVGRQTTVVDNTTTRYGQILVYFKVKQGTSPTGSRAVYFYLIRDDGTGTPIRTDAAGASDAAFTVITARLVYAAANKTSPATGDVIQGSFLVNDPGPKWAIAVVHDTGVNLDSTGGNHEIQWVGVNYEGQ